MALQLFKLASESFPQIVATTSQRARVFFRQMSLSVTLSAGVDYSLQVSRFSKEDGTAATAFPTGQGFNQLAINGVLQQPSLYSVNAAAIVLHPSSDWYLANRVITLQTFNVAQTVSFAALASSLVAIP